MTEAAEKYYKKLYPDGEWTLAETDPEFAEFFTDFACDEVVGQDDLDDRTRMMAVLAALLGCQGLDEFKEILPGALNLGVTPGEGNCISGMCLPWHWPGPSFPDSGQ